LFVFSTTETLQHQRYITYEYIPKISWA